ncbi:MAG: M15 family metallopeptidase [Acidimicrobiia bacterium]
MRRGSLALLVLIVAACSTAGTDAPTTSWPRVTTTTRVPTTTTTVPTTTTFATTTTTNPYARPDWMGTRLLPLRPDEFGVVQPTPPEMRDRQFETLDALPPPTDEVFHATIDPIPPDVLARSSWVPECPVALEELSYLTMSHFGFDQRFHTGEMIVNAVVAEQVVEIFRRLHEARFPIEQMRVITKEEIDAHPTGDWNDTTSFVCRPAVGSTSWSQHAFGTGIDINPFHNPYLKGDLVLPELASAYVDRDDVRVGMIVVGDVATEGFAEIGWGWGGHWSSLKDWMHFSLSGS